MVSCYQLEVRALQIAIAVIAVLIAQFVWLRPARLRLVVSARTNESGGHIMIVDLSGKVAIVTGAGPGHRRGHRPRVRQGGRQGRALPRAASANGQAVADSIVKDGGVAWLNQTDVGRRAEVKRVVAQTVERFGRLDIVVHNAAVYPVLSDRTAVG